ncbi:Integral membrane sensor signal transduction histidine kinase (fragment) [uncultured Pleomorphomonas sp.]|uniref:histidine kinase n=1 Tax=uncultured Pleomorphomonas sp. TaxID=442121 RepID=A0A212LG26_9HYPH
MSAPAPRVRQKWRPRLSLIIASVLALVASLPLGSIVFFRIYDNQLVRQTEAELIAQSAAIAARIGAELSARAPAGLRLGPPVRAGTPNADGLAAISPRLDLATDQVLPPRPEAMPAAGTAHSALADLGLRLTPELAAISAATLAGFRILDADGMVVAGGDEVGQSLAALPEVAGALAGHYRSALRQRVSRHPVPALDSISRGTGVRVFVALPVAVDGRVAAVVYASRTPADALKQLYQERYRIGLALLCVLAATSAIGFVFHRTIIGPMQALIARTTAIAGGDRASLKPLDHHGTAEFARLSQSFLDMAASLAARSDYVATFAAHVSHELKSPLTAISGAAELLADDASEPAMTPAQRADFLAAIRANADRLGALVSRLRDLARAETMPTAGACRLTEAIELLRDDKPKVAIEATGELDRSVAMSAETLALVLGHLVDNAARAGAGRVAISAASAAGRRAIVVADDGPGISPANRARIFDPFFTTRRADGGTGMGLSIARAMVTAHRGSLDLVDSGKGAAFRIDLPATTDPT